MRLRFVIACLVMPGLLRADTLAEVRGALLALKGQAPLTVLVQRSNWERKGGKDRSVNESVVLQDGPGGLLKPDGKHYDDGEWRQQTLTRAEAGLLDLLEPASVLEDGVGVLDGRPVRKLRVSLVGDQADALQENGGILKKMVIEATLWLGPDNLPLVVDQQVELAGRVALLFSFSSAGTEHRRYQKVLDHLVCVEATSDARAKGMGQSSLQRSTLRCSIQ